MNLSDLQLPPDLAEFVTNKISSGCCPSEDEVIRDALRLLRDRDRLRETRIAELREEIRPHWKRLAGAKVSRWILNTSKPGDGSGCATRAVRTDAASLPAGS